MWSIIFQFYFNSNEKITIRNFLICSLRSIKLLTSILLIWIISKIKQLNILKRKKKKNCLGSRFKLSIYHQYFTNRSASIHGSRQKIRQRTQLSFTEVSERTRLLRRVFCTAEVPDVPTFYSWFSVPVLLPRSDPPLLRTFNDKLV